MQTVSPDASLKKKKKTNQIKPTNNRTPKRGGPNLTNLKDLGLGLCACNFEEGGS